MYTIRLLSHVLAVLLPIAAAPVLAGSAHADHGSESRSAAQFLSGSVLGSDQSTVVGIDGASAEYRDGHTAGTEDHENATLNVTALSLLTIPLPDVELAVGGLLALGAVNQEAWAGPTGDSWATTDTASASLDLALLGPDPALSTADLNLGAIGTHAEVEGETGQLVRTTTIADLTLALQSPLVAGMTGDVNTVVSGLATDINALEPVLATTINQTAGEVMQLIGIPGDVTANTTVVVDTSRLDQAVAGVLDQTLCTGLVCIDLSNGVITVDLAGGLDLNNLAPNTGLTELLTQVSVDVATLMGQVQTELNEIMVNALDHVDITIDSDTTVSDPLLGDLGGLTIDHTGTLQDLVDGSSPPTVAGSGTTGTLLTPLLAEATDLVETAIVDAVHIALGSAVAVAGRAVDAAVADVASALDPVLIRLAGVADITLNEQNPGDGMTAAATVTAVAVDVRTGPLADVTLDLATSSVGPNAFARTTPTTPTTPGATDPVDNTATGTPPVDSTAPGLDTTGPTSGQTGNDTTPATDALLPATGSPFGVGVLVLLVLLGMGMITAGASLVRHPVVRS